MYQQLTFLWRTVTGKIPTLIWFNRRGVSIFVCLQVCSLITDLNSLSPVEQKRTIFADNSTIIFISFALKHMLWVLLGRASPKAILLNTQNVSFYGESSNMSWVVRKPGFCICENKGTDQLHSNCAADQRLCFHYEDSTIPLLPKS